MNLFGAAEMYGRWEVYLDGLFGPKPTSFGQGQVAIRRGGERFDKVERCLCDGVGEYFVVVIQMCTGPFVIGVEDFAGFFDIREVILFESIWAGDINDEVAFDNGEAGRGVGDKFKSLSAVLCNDVAEF